MGRLQPPVLARYLTGQQLFQCSEEYAKANGMPILGRIMGYATHSQKPEEFTIAPVGAVKNFWIN